MPSVSSASQSGASSSSLNAISIQGRQAALPARRNGQDDQVDQASTQGRGDDGRAALDHDPAHTGGVQPGQTRPASPGGHRCCSRSSAAGLRRLQAGGDDRGEHRGRYRIQAGWGPRSNCAPGGVRAWLSSTIGCGSGPSTSRTVRRGLSASTVPTPIRSASCAERSRWVIDLRSRTAECQRAAIGGGDATVEGLRIGQCDCGAGCGNGKRGRPRSAGRQAGRPCPFRRPTKVTASGRGASVSRWCMRLTFVCR